MPRARSYVTACLLGLLGLLSSTAYALTVTVAYDYSNSGQLGFQLRRCTGAACTPATNVGSILGPSVRQTTDATVSGGTSYCYGVVALGDGTTILDSPLSSALCIAVPAPGVATQLAYSVPPQASTNTNASMNTVTVQVLDGFGAVVTGSTVQITVALTTPVQTAIPQNQVSLVSVDSQETVGETAPGTRALDGNTATYWHTEWFTQTALLPHTIIVNLGASYNVTGVTYTPRQDGSPNGTIAQYQVSVSADGSTWGVPASSGTFTANTSAKTITFMGKQGQYLRLIAQSELNGNQWTSVAELVTLQTPSGSGQLQGTTVRNAVTGVASFPSLSVNQAGSYTLIATATGLTSSSSPFTIVDSPTPVHVPIVRRMGH